MRKGGKVLWAGGGIRGGIIAPVDTYKIIVKELDIIGEISQVPYDWHTAIHLVGMGSVRTEPLVTHYYDLKDWETGFDLADDQEAAAAVCDVRCGWKAAHCHLGGTGSGRVPPAPFPPGMCVSI